MKRWGSNPSKFNLPPEIELLHRTRLVNQTLRTHYALDDVAGFDAEFIQDVYDYRAELVRQLNLALKKPKTPGELILLSEVLMQLL